MQTLRKWRIPVDLMAVIVLLALCWLFYWRLLTPNLINQQSLVEGDFSGQFVAFAHYQAERFAQGQVPLWNPYNYGGHPFLADTQAAAFYPPRLLTIAALNATGGSSPQRMYYALQNEMVLHALIASLLMYALVRRLTLEQPYSVIGGLVAGITFAYSGYLTGYPQLQLAVMEAGVWLPLMLLGIHEATRLDRVGWRWFGLTGIALGLSLAAGHPQTTLFSGYVTLAYLLWRTLTQQRRWTVFVIGAAIFGVIGVGLAAVQLIPGWEYTRLTVRTTLNVDALGNGFPFYDVLQVIFPGILSLWSPLYFGVVALALVIYAVWRRTEGAIFWLVIAAVALGLSFGHGTIIYDVFYNVVPGFSLFRGQERSAFVIAVSMSILAGLGIISLLQSGETTPRRYPLVLWGIAAAGLVLSAGLFVNWLIVPGTDNKHLGLVTFSFFVAILTAVLLTDTLVKWSSSRWRGAAIIGLVVFELFSFGRGNPNLEPKPAADRLTPPPLVTPMQADKDNLFRIDGAHAVGENYGTLYGLMDIQGISPLRLVSVDRLLKLAPSCAWQALSVRYVPIENTALLLPSTIVSTQDRPEGPLYLHQLTTVRPFARLVYRTWIEPDDNAALGVLCDPSYNMRESVILPTDPGVTLPASAPTDSAAEVTHFAPEAITIHTKSAEPAILGVALVYYPSWQATIDGQATTLLRADTALTALVVPSGDHTIQLDYRPASYTIGAAISLVTLLLMAIGALSGLAVSFRTRHSDSTGQ
ncbi:MAG: YfhO family protein [Chloroflexota bacterium]